MKELLIKNLHVNVEGKEILKGVLFLRGIMVANFMNYGEHVYEERREFVWEF